MSSVTAMDGANEGKQRVRPSRIAFGAKEGIDKSTSERVRSSLILADNKLPGFCLVRKSHAKRRQGQIAGEMATGLPRSPEEMMRVSRSPLTMSGRQISTATASAAAR